MGLTTTGFYGMGYFHVRRDSLPQVFTLAWPLDVDAISWPREARRERPRLLVFRRDTEGRLPVDDFQEEADIHVAAVAQLAPTVVRLERGRLSTAVESGQAVYVPGAPSHLPGCRRYGRLSLHRAEE